MEENLATHIDKIDPTAYIAEGAVVLGDVTLEAESSIWFNAVLRGDCAPIRIAARSNVQDGCVLHADYGFPCVVGEGVTIGHGAIVHGATLEENVLIGMNAVVQNGAVVGANSIVAVGAVVKQGMQVPPGSLVIGVPGKVRRQTSDEEIQMNRLAAAHYVESALAYAKQGIGLMGEDVADEMSDDPAEGFPLSELGEAFSQMLGGVSDDDDSDDGDSDDDEWDDDTDDNTVEIVPGDGDESPLAPLGELMEGGEDIDLGQLGEAFSRILQGTPPQRHNLSSSCRSHGLRPRRFRNRGHNR